MLLGTITLTHELDDETGEALLGIEVSDGLTSWDAHAMLAMGLTAVGDPHEWAAITESDDDED